MDPYLDPLSGVLRNLLGITDAGELARAEAALSASRLVDLERCRLPGRYDLDHLRAFHRHILGDVYEWAGELRTVSIAKGSVFCLLILPGQSGLPEDELPELRRVMTTSGLKFFLPTAMTPRCIRRVPCSMKTSTYPKHPN